MWWGLLQGVTCGPSRGLAARRGAADDRKGLPQTRCSGGRGGMGSIRFER